MDPARRAYQAIVADPNNLKVLLENTFIIASHVNATATDPVKKQAARSTLDSSFRLLTSTLPNVRYRDPSEPYDWKDQNSYERQLATLTRPGATFTDLGSMLTAVAATPAATADAGLLATIAAPKPVAASVPTPAAPTSVATSVATAIDPNLIPVLAAISVTAPTPTSVVASVPASVSVPTPASVPASVSVPKLAETPETNAGVIPLLATISVTEPTAASVVAAVPTAASIPTPASVPTAASIPTPASVPTPAAVPIAASVPAIDADLIPLLAAISVTAPPTIAAKAATAAVVPNVTVPTGVPTGVTVVPPVVVAAQTVADAQTGVPTGVTGVAAAPTGVAAAQTGVAPVVAAAQTGVAPVVAATPTVAKAAPKAELTPLVVATSMFVDTPKEAAERRTQESAQSMLEAVQQRRYATEIEPAPDTFIHITFKGFEPRYLEKGQRVRIIPYETMRGLWEKINASGTMELPGILESKAKYKSYSMCMGTNVGTIIGFGYPKPSGIPPRYVPGSDMVQVKCENGTIQWFSAFFLYPSTKGGARGTRRKSRA